MIGASEHQGIDTQEIDGHCVPRFGGCPGWEQCRFNRPELLVIKSRTIKAR